MTRRLPLVVGTALLAGLAVAALSPAQVAPAARATRLRLDRLLIEAVVDSGIRLAAEDDPLARAQTCKELAARLAEEARRAALSRERERAADLGDSLQSLLVRGVAANLSLAHGEMPEDSPRLPEVRRVGKEAVALTLPLMQDLEREAEGEAPQMKSAVQALHRAQAEVERAVTERAPRKGRPPGKGRKGRGR